MSRVHLAADPRLLRTALATVQPAAGVLALLCSGTALGAVAGASAGTTVGWSGLVAIAAGIGLCAVWGLARRRRSWLAALAVAAAVFAAGMILITVLAGRAARYDEHRGWWSGVWLGAVAVLLWAVIAVAAALELRLLRDRSDDHQPRAGRPPVWADAAAVVTPVALIIAISILSTMIAPAWMIRANSRVTTGAPAVAAHPSELTGSVRWNLVSPANPVSVVTTAGLAVPVAADRDHNAGVIMIDPVSGKINWRYELRGLDKAPELSRTDHGRAVVVRFDEADLPDQVPYRVFTLDAATGKINASWPADVIDTDPPVSFHHVARGTNSVSGLSADGRKLWTFKPERCADPRTAASTPDVILVPARKCDESQDSLSYQLHGLDARSGDQLWTRPWDSESTPLQAVVRAGFQVEVNGPTLRRRNLRTGTIDWTAHLPCSEPPATTASRHTLFSYSCARDHQGGGRLAGYDLATGEQLWQRPVPGRELIALAAVDDHRAVALSVDLSGKHRSCRADLLGATTSRPLQSFRQDSRADDPLAQYRPGLVECQDSSVYQSAGSFVLQIGLATPPSANRGTESLYRFIGLA